STADSPANPDNRAPRRLLPTSATSCAVFSARHWLFRGRLWSCPTVQSCGSAHQTRYYRLPDRPVLSEWLSSVRSSSTRAGFFPSAFSPGLGCVVPLSADRSRIPSAPSAAQPSHAGQSFPAPAVLHPASGKYARQWCPPDGRHLQCRKWSTAPQSVLFSTAVRIVQNGRLTNAPALRFHARLVPQPRPG